jgi:hypothetical protein
VFLERLKEKNEFKSAQPVNIEPNRIKLVDPEADLRWYEVIVMMSAAPNAKVKMTRCNGIFILARSPVSLSGKLPF